MTNNWRCFEIAVEIKRLTGLERNRMFLLVGTRGAAASMWPTPYMADDGQRAESLRQAFNSQRALICLHVTRIPTTTS